MTILSKEVTRAMQGSQAGMGGLYSASNAAAGVAPGTAFSTTPPLVLWNPADSKVNLILLESSCGFVSGTLGAGFLGYGQVAQATAPTGGTELTVRGTVLGNTGGPSGTPGGFGRAFTGSTLSGTPVLLQPALILSGSAPFVPIPRDYCEGSIIVPPGQALSLQGIAAAGTTPLVVLAFKWVEQKY